MFAFLVVIIKDRDTGSSRGFGFVTFQESKNANAAIEALHKSVSSDSSLTSVFKHGIFHHCLKHNCLPLFVLGHTFIN